MRTAIALADREGIGAVSMRRVAAELGSGAMTLYRYVPDKEELVRLMADAAFGARALPEPGPPGWRAQLELVAHLQWRTYRRHPWLAPVMLTSLAAPPVVSSGLAHVDWSLRALDGLALDERAKLHLVVSLNGYVGGLAITRSLEAEQEHRCGITGEQRQSLDRGLFQSLIGSGRFPALAENFAHDVGFDLDELFDFGLQRHLDGLEAFLGGVSPPTTGA
ncbi:TetR/AcrR family transcriptional regulator [Saccharopolyspora griseoalba]|uniref:TetR/AcrR family transcriptional regulator n=1 Tax=Saccharopolyspora griseoalba TaxID=1431848 RepID=A0ABW2LE66_9PSEU